jgi:putative sigma-54 modulation protein
MQLLITGKNVEVTDWLRAYIEKKIGKLDRYLPTIIEARVELLVQETKSAKDRQRVQVTVRDNGTLLRAEEKSADMFASIDAVLDKMYRQIARYKERRQDRRTAGEAPPIQVTPEEDDVRLPEIVRVKRFRVTPMSPDEAVEQMELLGHDFYVFQNPDGDQLSVLYRRHDGNYGLLEPQGA